MYKIQKVTIEGLWKEKNVSINLNEDVNFFIGPNGTGKTTIIHLIASVIKMNIQSLFKQQFQSIKIDLIGHYKRLYILVEKFEDTASPYLTYTIKKNTSKPKKYEFFFRDRYDRTRRPDIRDSYAPTYYAEVKREIDSLLKLSWISVNRISLLNDSNYRDNPTINTVLNQLKNDLKGYFSLLTNKCNDETDKFQKFVFRSLLDVVGMNKQLEIINGMIADSGAEINKLKDIFKLFSMLDQNLSDTIDDFYTKIHKSAHKINSKKPVTLIDFSYLVNGVRIQTIISEWNSVSSKQQAINSRKNVFLEIIENMFQHKKLMVNESNELQVVADDGTTFPIEFLSSGEKQLLIILGNALLHNQDEMLVYLADEPELSLHIEWQEKLVMSLRRLTPNAQIIFATHSPDIVGPFHDKTINFDKIIYGERIY